tara:strand:- start:3816 stop:3989 length:174 start_codon:yes stop_codon:yes gene_type:complete
MKASSKDRYTVTKWVRANVPCEHPDLDYREALDIQRLLTKKEGAKDYIYIYTIEESS